MDRDRDSENEIKAVYNKMKITFAIRILWFRRLSGQESSSSLRSHDYENTQEINESHHHITLRLLQYHMITTCSDIIFKASVIMTGKEGFVVQIS